MPEFQLTDNEVDELLERYDRTEPALQRRIFVRILEKLAVAEAKIRELESQIRSGDNGA